MNPILPSRTTLLRLVLLATIAVSSAGLSGCTTNDVSEDTTVYPTPAEKNRQMQERMSEVTRSFM